jgi:leucyl-tRNA synthetase
VEDLVFQSSRRVIVAPQTRSPTSCYKHNWKIARLRLSEDAALVLIVRVLDGKTPKRVIVMPNRIVNVVV